VLYVDPPVSRLSPRRDRHAASALEGPRLRQISDQLARLTVVVPPGRSKPAMRWLVGQLTTRAMRRAVRRLGLSVDAVVVASLAPVLRTFPGATRVLYATDDFRAGAALMGLDTESVARLERRAIADADIVVAVSDHLAGVLRGRGAEAVVVENGVDFERFSRASPLAGSSGIEVPPPIAGFAGNISDRIDVALLEAIADRGHSLLLVGPRQPLTDEARFAAVLRRPNVQWVDYRPFEDLPSWVASMHVGLVPYRVDEFNRASSPLKVLEYLAVGADAVSTSLPSVAALGDLVRTADTPDAFADEVSRALAAPRSDELVAKRQAVARDRSWDAAAAAFARAIGLRTDAPDGVVSSPASMVGQGAADVTRGGSGQATSERVRRTYSASFYETIVAGSRRSADVVAPLVHAVVSPSSVVDVGCGLGTWLAAFKQCGVTDVVGLDGGGPDREALQIEPAEYVTSDLTKPIRLDRTFSLAISLEVGEHLPEHRSASFVEDLCRLAPVVLFSAAIPGQGGTSHITERWPSYWVELFARAGLELIDRIRPTIWRSPDVESWYAQNVLLFATPEAAAGLDLGPLSTTDYAGFPLVHPALYEAQKGQVSLADVSPRSLLSMAARSASESARCLVAIAPSTLARLRRRADRRQRGLD
jgi:teichuronic acid biosynthesis glycosyltransferase TuaH